MTVRIHSALSAIALLSLCGGCTALLHLDDTQCHTNADCEARGPAFQGMVCLATSCVQPSVVSSGDGGLPSPSNSSGGMDAGTGGSDTGAPDSADAGGCVSNTQCVADNLGEPYACLKKGDPCVALKTEECPIVMGNYNDDNALYVGAFLNLPAASPLSQMSALNVQLAVNEINGSVGGLPGGPLGKLRPLATVACRNDPTLLDAAAAHLMNDVHAPGVIANLASADLKNFFVNYALPNSAFVINPGFADNTLTSLTTAGLLWHVIGDIRDVAPAYRPLVTRTETYLRAGGATGDLKVAMLVTNRYAEQSIADTVTPLLQWNGKSVTDNGSNFFTTSVPSLTDTPNADYSTINSSIVSFQPDIIISIAREELVYKIMPVVEASWPAGARRPMYILPNAVSGNLDLLKYLGIDDTNDSSETKRTRQVGVAPASALDTTMYDQFMIRFRTANPQFQNAGGFENFYDSAYLLAYAMYGAGSVPALTGPDIARGMQKTVTGSTVVDIGPTHLADGFAALAAGGSISMNGTMGPSSDFDPGVGARRGNGSVYCVNRASGALSFLYDVLRYDTTNAVLHGTFPCFTGF
ncbi:MAG TPA: hypothetical protein VGI39_31205 [Polyangiaceae bacterium]